MVKKTLEDKIKDLTFCTCVFLILYLISGYLLLSNWLAERVALTKIYDLIKDDLTITASLLAPVAALLVFNDWRETHARVNNEKLSSEIIEIFQEMNAITSKGYNEYAKEKVMQRSDGEKISLLLKDLISKISRINSVDSEADEFKSLSYTMRNIFLDWWNYINLAAEDYIDINFTGIDPKIREIKFNSMNENGNKAQKKAILFSNKFRIIEPLLV